VETVTTNLSSDGFHCYAPVLFERDEILACTLRIPAAPIGADRAPHRVLECQVRVVRTEPVNREGYYGIGCRIETYRIATAAKPND